MSQKSVPGLLSGDALSCYLVVEKMGFESEQFI